MLRKLVGAFVMLVVLAGGRSISAHHSFAAEYDIDKRITLQGTVTKVDWVNPHVYIHFDAKDASGKVTTWALTTFSPGAVRRAGVTRASFGQGQQVTVVAYHAKDGSNLAFLRKMTFADGHSVELWLGEELVK